MIEGAGAGDYLCAAAGMIGRRGSEYDPSGQERSMKKIVELFNLKTGHGLTETEGWLFMMTLKEVRFATAPRFHADSVIDLIAYAALMAESAREASDDEFPVAVKVEGAADGS